jgi:hypothetical protein
MEATHLSVIDACLKSRQVLLVKKMAKVSCPCWAVQLSGTVAYYVLA